MANGNFGLSLLSRGVGEQRNSGKSQKVEVLLEPEDYFNIQRKGYYLPPIHHQAWTNEELSPRTVHAHKTYTTRKGALLLYAEDLALSYPTKHRQKARRKSLEAEDSKYFNTMKDLRSAVLSYGAKDQQGENIFMGFNNSKINNFNSPRSVRPGFSARRYLANWSKSWDDSILNYLRSEGHLWDKNLFESNSVMPSVYKRINDDMSYVPPPYRVTRNMLLSPGDIVSYEFYRIRPDDVDYGTRDSSRHGQQPHPSPETGISSSGMIAAIARDGEHKPHPVVYSQLDRSEQQMVLQKLILQSAAHHNQEKMEIIRDDLPDSQVMMLDMNQAIANLVTSNSENLVAGGNVFSIPEAPQEESYSESAPSESSWPDVVEKVVYEEVAPQIPKSASFSSVQPLPPITKQQTLDLKESAQLSQGQVDFKLPEISKGNPLPSINAQPLTDTIEDVKTGRYDDVSDAQNSEAMHSSEYEEGKGDKGIVENMSLTSPTHQVDSRKTVMSNERKESGSRLSSSSQLSQSFEDLNLANEQLTSLKGGVIPKNRTESMRSYKRSRGRGSAGSDRSDLLHGEEDSMSVVGSVFSAPSERRVSGAVEAEAFSTSKEEARKKVLAGEEDAKEKEEEMSSTAPSSHGPIEIPVGSEVHEKEEECTESPTTITETEKVADGNEVVNKEDSQMAESIENEGREFEHKDNRSLKDAEGSSRNNMASLGYDQVGEIAKVQEEPSSLASGMEEATESEMPTVSSQELDDAFETGGDGGLDGASRVDGASELNDAPGFGGGLEMDGVSEVDGAPLLDDALGLEGESGVDGAPGIDGAPELDGATGLDDALGFAGASGLVGTPGIDDPTMAPSGSPGEEPPSGSPHQQLQSSQKLPTASIGSDLAEDVAVSENSFPKSRRRSSVPSEAGSVRSLQDAGVFSMSEFFTNFSYKGRGDSDRSSWWSGRGSMPSSLDSDADETEIASLDEDNSETGDDWPQVEAEDDQAMVGPSAAENDLQNDDIDSEAIINGDLLKQSNLTSDDLQPGADESSVTDLIEDGSIVQSQKSDEIARSRHSSSRASSLMEQLEEEAAAIAEAVLQRPKSGRDLAEDAQLAASLWRERLGQLFQLSRPAPDDTQSMIERRRKNSFDGSSVASLDVGHWDGLDLSTGKTQRSRRKRRVSSAQATVDLVDDPSENELPPSAPLQKVSGGDSLELDVTNFGVGDRTDVSTKLSQRRESESQEDEELKKIVEDTGLLSRTSETAASKKSKGSKSSKSQKSDKSSTKSGKSQKSGKDDKSQEKTKEFIVSMPHDDKQDFLAYKPAPEPEEKTPQETGKSKSLAPKPPKKPKKEKGKKTKKPKKTDAKKEEPAAAKKDEEKDDESHEEAATEKVENVMTEGKEESSKDAEPLKEDGDAVENLEEGSKEEEEVEVREEVESPEFIIIHEEFSDSEPEEVEPQPEMEQPSVTEFHEEANMSEVETEYTEDSTNRPGSLTRSQARAAKRAAENERKKREIDRKRREKEELRRKAQEEQERKERIKREFEEEKLRKEEQMRFRKEAEEEARRKAEQAQKERARQAELAAERERKQQEEYKRKLEELAKKKKEEDRIRQEMEAQRLKEEAERKREEEEMLAKMEEEERLEYERRKQEEELLAQMKAEEERIRRELEAKLAQEEAERLALEMAKRQKELEMRMNFNRELNAEANIFAHSQEMTRAFTWSYFELLEYLGIPIPDNLRQKYLKGQLVPQNHEEMHGEPKDSGDG